MVAARRRRLTPPSTSPSRPCSGVLEQLHVDAGEFGPLDGGDPRAWQDAGRRVGNGEAGRAGQGHGGGKVCDIPVSGVTGVEGERRWSENLTKY